MRVAWSLVLVSGSAFALSTSKFAEDVTNKLLETNNTDNDLTIQCTQFVRNCLEACEQEIIGNFTSTCSSREATCICNHVDFSAQIFATMLQDVPSAMTTNKNKLQVEGNDNNNGAYKPVQFNALREADQKALEEREGDEMEAEDGYPSIVTQREFQHMEFIQPEPQLVKDPLFQENYCSHYLIRCKQDCPAAFTSYSCDANSDKTGFLLSCVCNSIDIAASVNAQVQAEL